MQYIDNPGAAWLVRRTCPRPPYGWPTRRHQDPARIGTCGSHPRKVDPACPLTRYYREQHDPRTCDACTYQARTRKGGAA